MGIFETLGGFISKPYWKVKKRGHHFDYWTYEWNN